MRLVFAYLDPGSASIVFQAVIAGIIAVPVLFRNKIAAMVRSVRGGGTEEAKETVAEPTTTDTTAR
jgi:hypothetical protein